MYKEKIKFDILFNNKSMYNIILKFVFKIQRFIIAFKCKIITIIPYTCSEQIVIIYRIKNIHNEKLND